MSQRAEDAALRMLLRQYAPNLKQMFIQVALAFKERIPDLYMVMLHKPDGDLNNPKDHVIQVKSFKSKQVANLGEDPTKEMDAQGANTLAELFPVAASLLADYAQEWRCTPKDLFLFLRIVEGTGDVIKDTTDLRIRTKKGIEPKQEAIIS